MRASGNNEGWPNFVHILSVLVAVGIVIWLFLEYIIPAAGQGAVEYHGQAPNSLALVVIFIGLASFGIGIYLQPDGVLSA